MPEHPQLRAFEAQIGEQIKPSKRGDSIPVTMDSVPPPAVVVKRTKPPSVAAPPADVAAVDADRAGDRATSVPAEPLDREQPVTPPAPAVMSRLAEESAPAAAAPTPEPPPVVAVVAVAAVAEPTPEPPRAVLEVVPEPEPTPAPPVAAPAAAPPPAVASVAGGDADAAKVLELRALAEKQEAAKRYNEFVKTLIQLAGLVYDADEKIELYTKAADLYVNKFANQAEAVKAYEAILAVDPDHAQAIEYLRQMYEKRRDWEKLLGLQRREAERLDPGPERAARFLEMAKLATERVKKPEVCIELWQEVLEQRRRERSKRSGRSRGALRAEQGVRQADLRPGEAGGAHVRRAGEDPGPLEARDHLRRPAQQ